MSTSNGFAVLRHRNFSFYLAAQGASLLYLAILGVYALAMARQDKRYARALARAGAPS